MTFHHRLLGHLEAVIALLIVVLVAVGSAGQVGATDCSSPDDLDCDGIPDAEDNCPASPNPAQQDADNDGEGDACDLDDGMILMGMPDSDHVAWQPEAGYESFNLYRGDLRMLRDLDQYTQDPARVPLAGRRCDLTSPSVLDNFIPPPGRVMYYLVSGNAGGVEESLGTDSDGNERPNPVPCAPGTEIGLRTVVLTDKEAYLPGETVQITVVISNFSETSSPTFNFNTGCQSYFVMQDEAGSIVYDHSRQVGCPDALTQLRLEPGESRHYPFTWYQEDDFGNPVEVSGEYTIRALWEDNQPAPTGSQTILLLSGPFLRTAVRLDGSSYAPGQPVQIEVVLSNWGDAPATLHFPSSCQAHFVVESGMSTVIYDSRRYRSCLQIFTDLTLQPGESHTFPFTWDQRDNDGDPVSSGLLFVRGGIESLESAPEGLNWFMILASDLSLRTSVSTDRDEYLAGEPVAITVVLTNIGEIARTLTFGSCLAHFAVESDNLSIVFSNRGDNSTCDGTGGGVRELTLQPGESRDFGFIWDQRDYNGWPLPAPAAYTIRGIIDSNERVPDARRSIYVRSEP